MSDFDWYRSFVAVYRHGTVSGAAQARALTQPAVSQHLAALETALGGALFTRTPRRMVPTERGRELYGQVAAAVDTLEAVSQGVKSRSEAEWPLVRLGAPVGYVQARVLERFGGLAVRLWLRFGTTPELVAALEAGDVDLAIVTRRLSTQPVEFRKLATQTFWLVGPPGLDLPECVRLCPESPLENAPAIERWLLERTWISYGVDLPIIRSFWQQCFKKRPHLQPALVIPDLRAIARAVELGLGISLLPDHICRESVEAGRLRVLWEPPTPVVSDLWLAQRRADHHSAAVQAVADRLLDGLA